MKTDRFFSFQPIVSVTFLMESFHNNYLFSIETFPQKKVKTNSIKIMIERFHQKARLTSFFSRIHVMSQGFTQF